ncbi:MAG: competence protein ComEA [Chloroflexota bacterium]|nr:competence protein ComEA [Chloroflexota bacterium]
MDPSLTPWRALEDPPDRGGSPQGAAPPSGIPRSALLAGAGAILLAVAAFVLAFGTGPGGTDAVEGGAALVAVASNGGTPSSSADSGVATASHPVLVVEIVGAIENPGVFRLPPGSRIGDLVTAGGGYSPRVDADRAGRDLNLAAPLHDGDQVRVPSRDDAAAPASRPSAGTPSSGKPGAPLDLNRATAAELDGLPGIGPVTAAKIIASREQQPFIAVQDLRTRKLVGEKTFANLKDLVAVP